MKKSIILLLLLILLFPLYSAPCFEELECVAMSLASSRLSRPQLSLPGVKMEGERMIPERVVLTASDVSSYYSALRRKPRGGGLLSNVLFSYTQRSSLMNQVQNRLLALGYEEGDLIVDGCLTLREKESPDEAAILMRTDLSSIRFDVDVNLILRERKNEWIIRGELKVSGDSEHALVVKSDEICINESKYKVDLKYRLKKDGQEGNN